MKASLESSGRLLERQHNERMSLAWHIAALTRIKKIPKLDRLQAKQSAVSRQPQSWQQQMAIMDMWAARSRQIAAAEKSKAH